MSENGRWNGRPLREWVAPVVDDIVVACGPMRVIFFGSVARDEEGADSDFDFFVVLNEVQPEKRPRLVALIRRAISAPGSRRRVRHRSGGARTGEGLHRLDALLPHDAHRWS